MSAHENRESATPQLLLAEFNALRSEIVARQQAQGSIVTAALTVIAAIGGFALAKKEGRLEMLLVLPIVLSGLGLLLVDNTHGTHRIGLYIGEVLWHRLDDSGYDGELASWEAYIGRYRAQHSRKLSTYVALGTLPAFLIMAVPSLASLVITIDVLDTALWPLWVSGVLALVALTVLAWSLRKPPIGPTGQAE